MFAAVAVARRRAGAGAAARLLSGRASAAASASASASASRLPAARSLPLRRPLSSSSSHPPHTPPFDKILIANRGEIACRVIRTCRRLGVRTVAVYSDADGPESLHASMADECYQTGIGPSPAESYLRGEEVLDVALHTGAQAVHPGYGFLSENPTFASLASDSDVAFVGPPPSAISAMGSKSRSKTIMEEAGVPTAPGYHGDDQDSERLLHEAVRNVGFPLLIKAVMGGGGKGMRIVTSEADFLSALESCRRESQASFDDDRVILERLLVNPRHVEVQVVADTHGNAIHLYERDCSLQRRHQKIIEEAPASDLPEELRAEMGSMAVRAAKAVGYVNAGTVEFLLDTAQPPSPEGGYYFCEMNTRLQVEHPITELITGIDLVEWQLRIAAGEELPITNQADVPCVGHAMEARIYAENPSRDFLPATGRVWHHDPPASPNAGVSDDGVRVDTGIKTGRDITVHYDPMVSKLVVHGCDRDEALSKLVRSLKRYRIAGVPTNIPFLVKCAAHPTFGEAGAINTGFLDEHADDVKLADANKFDGSPKARLERAIAALAVSLQLEDRVGLTGPLDHARRMNAGGRGGPWGRLSGSWRMGGAQGRFKRTLRPFGGRYPTVECVSNRDGSFDVTVRANEADDDEDGGDDGGSNEPAEFSLDGRMDNTGRMDVLLDGTKHLSFAVATRECMDEGSIDVCVWSLDESHDEEHTETGYAWNVTFRHPLPVGSHAAADSSLATGAGAGAIRSPMPGKIIRVLKSEGDAVTAGETVLVVEAMKMEHAVTSTTDGVLAEVRAEAGDIVEDGAVLASVVSADKEAKEEERDEEGEGAEGTAYR